MLCFPATRGVIGFHAYFKRMTDFNPVNLVQVTLRGSMVLIISFVIWCYVPDLAASPLGAHIIQQTASH